MAGLIIGETYERFSTGTLGSGVTFPVGHILQVIRTDDNSVTSSWTEGASCAVNASGVIAQIDITSTNKILVSAHCTIGANLNGEGMWKIMRKIGGGSYADVDSIGDAVGSCSRMHVGGSGDYLDAAVTQTSGATFLDNPATASTVYYQIYIERWDGTTYLNRPDSTTLENAVGTSGITLMEVQQ